MNRRNTFQRKIVLESLEYLGHASNEELIEYIQKNYDNISLATIYRNITILLEEGQIKRVKFHEKDVLETVKHNHSHFVCEKCGNIIDVNVNKNFENSDSLKGFKVLESEVSLYGLCAQCQENLINE